MSHVVVRLGGDRFALPLAHVAEVGRLPAITRVPGTPAWVTGVANWRGRILGVVDIRVVLHVEPAAQHGGGTRVVVLSHDGADVGMIAERVEGVMDVDLDAIEPALLTLDGDADSLLLGQVTDETGAVGVLDTGAVLALRHRLHARRAG